MLMNNEIKVGEIYAWDTLGLCSNGELGCHLWTIRSVDEELLTVESLDGGVITRFGSHCLIPAQRALKRLEILRGLEKPESDTHERWKYNREVEHLTAFETAYNAYVNA